MFLQVFKKIIQHDIFDWLVFRLRILDRVPRSSTLLSVPNRQYDVCFVNHL